ncbi:hypothetical protein GW17_00007861 [Ensete ventricosum]|nr:hypothetical protein GW17_00007861 [Ensete ventricosum]
MVDDSSSIADAAGGDASVELTRRCRHAAAAVGDLIFIYGGLRGVTVKRKLKRIKDFHIPPFWKRLMGLNKGVEYLVEASAAEAEAISATLAAAKARQVNGEVEQLPDRDRGSEATPSGKLISSMVKVPDPSAAANTPPTGVRLHHRAVIAHLLKPRGWKPPVRRQFFLDCNEIADLCDSAERIFTSEPTVLQIKAPVKIFGDLHGQFGDLMRLFDEYGAPSTAGDIA